MGIPWLKLVILGSNNGAVLFWVELLLLLVNAMVSYGAQVPFEFPTDRGDGRSRCAVAI